MKNVLISSNASIRNRYFARGDVIVLDTKKTIELYFNSIARGYVKELPKALNVDILSRDMSTGDGCADLTVCFLLLCYDFGIRLDSVTFFNSKLITDEARNRIFAEVIQRIIKYRPYKLIRINDVPKFIANEPVVL